MELKIKTVEWNGIEDETVEWNGIKEECNQWNEYSGMM